MPRHDRLALPVLVSILVLCAVIASHARPVPEPAVAGAEGPPTRGIDAGNAHSARLAIGHLGSPLLLVENPGLVPRQIEVALIDSSNGRFRRHEIQLEAGGSQPLSLVDEVPFEDLAIVADGPIGVVLEDLSSDFAEEVAVERFAPSSAQPELGFEKELLQCDGTWNLSCATPSTCGNYNSGYESGKVRQGDQVYWHLHYPVGAWTTTNGSCLTYWTPANDGTGCPATAWNCYGQLYDVEPNAGERDLTILSASASPTTLLLNSDVTVTHTVKNEGSYSVSGYHFCIYRSSDTVLDSGDWRHSVTASNATLGPGATRTYNTTFNVFPTGSHYLLVEADCDDYLDEGDESNNVTNAGQISVIDF